ncbi:MAG: hypothetical protein ABH807_02385, partial [Candidatus Shapirobacteria bacterium]
MKSAQELISTKQLIKLAKSQGISLGKGNPNNRLRYYTKTDLIPHAERKQVGKSSFTEGHYPRYTLNLLKRIGEMKRAGRPTPEIQKHLAGLRLKYDLTGKAKLLGEELVVRKAVTLRRKAVYATAAILILIITAIISVYFIPATPPPALVKPEVAGINMAEETPFLAIQSSGDNLLANSSFEKGLYPITVDREGKSSFGQAWRWGYTEMGNKDNIYVSPESIRSGSLAMKFWDPAVDGGKMKFGISQQETTTVNGRNYHLSLWVRSRDLTGNPKIRLGFTGEVSKDDPNYNMGSGWEKYKQDQWKDFALKDLPPDWHLVSFEIENAPRGKFPFIEVVDYQGGVIFVDDAGMNVGGRGGVIASSMTLGAGSIISDVWANLFPADNLIGSLGLADHRFAALYVNDADLRNNLTVGGNSDLNGNLDVAGAATISGNLKLTGDKINVSNRFADSLLPYLTNEYTLGSADYHWNTAYITNLYAGASGTVGYWQRNSQALSPTNITDDFLLGSTATSSALIKLTGTGGNDSWINTGNVGIGTTGPTALFSVGAASPFTVTDAGLVTTSGGATITGTANINATGTSST